MKKIGDVRYSRLIDGPLFNGALDDLDILPELASKIEEHSRLLREALQKNKDWRVEQHMNFDGRGSQPFDGQWDAAKATLITIQDKIVSEWTKE